MKKAYFESVALRVTRFCLFVIIFMSFSEVCFAKIDKKFRFNVGQTYDDNITYESINKINDNITNVTAGGDLTYEGRIQSLSLGADVTHQFYVKNHNFDNTSERARGNYLLELSKNERITLADSFYHSFEPRSFEDEFGRLDGRYSFYNNAINFDYLRDISKQLNLDVRYSNNMYTYSTDSISDSYLNSGGLGLNYAINSSSIVYMNYDYSQRKFKNGPKSSKNTIAPALRQYFTRQLYADLRPGIDFIKGYDGTKYTRANIFLSLTNEIDEATTNTFTFTKLYDTNSYTKEILDSWRCSLNFSRQLTRRLGTAITAFYGNGKYESTKTTDKMVGAAAGLTYDLTKNLKATLNYTYSDTSSNVPTREYIRTAVTCGLRMEF
ncbi:MAG: outer membrane beta-barrel protein [Candidatus Omnitrophica bacterium]|nr:outer membrane beta-barrel protein [Candidatus Omnitrophota bacterium]